MKVSVPFRSILLLGLVSLCGCDLKERISVTPSEAPLATTVPEMVAASSLATPGTVLDDQGVKRLTGSINYTDFGIPMLMQSPSPTLLDMVHVVRNDPSKFAPLEGQILGYMTSPVSPPPLSYAFDLPQVPTATLIDVDNNPKKDLGVQIFRLAMASNINGDSYLQQLDQEADLNSYLVDPHTGKLTEGSLLVYAPDGEQAFPNAFGKDGILFTSDDPVAPLQRGYTVVHFGSAGFSFDRSTEAKLNVLESAQTASPDFSDQGIVESFHSLITYLAKHYSFTDLRKLDWEAIRAEYLPQVQEAEALAAQNPDFASAAYATALHRLAQSIRDAHVAAAIDGGPYPSSSYFASAIMGPVSTNIGANTSELADGRIIVTDVVRTTPADQAGWKFGTQLVSINGKPVTGILPSVIYNRTTGTAEGQRLQQVANLLKFPTKSPEVTIEAILPGSATPQSFKMTPNAFPLRDRLMPVNRRGDMPIDYEMLSNVGYICWDNFHEPGVRMAVFEQFMEVVSHSGGLAGIVLDLRGNSGGWDNLYFTMASYFFGPENPVSMHWIDQEVYDPGAGGFVRETPNQHLLSAPRPKLFYDGPIIVLTDHNTASSGEFFSQFLQSKKRARVVAQYATKGAGAPINRVKLSGPAGKPIFQYTKGRIYFAGTQELNLEAKGVIPDVRVPVTLETEQAILRGSDPVLTEGMRLLIADSLKLIVMPAEDAAKAGFSTVHPDGWTKAITEGSMRYSSPVTQATLIGEAIPASDAAKILSLWGISDPKGAPWKTRQANNLEWSIYQGSSDGNFAYFHALAQSGAKAYALTLAAPLKTADALELALLDPVIDAFRLPGAEGTPAPNPNPAAAAVPPIAPKFSREHNSPRLRELDFGPFTAALAKVDKSRLARVESIVTGGDLAKVQAALQAKEFTSEELTLFFLERIRRLDGTLRSYIELNPKCLDEAKAADALRTSGKLLGDLHGIPLNLKDNIATAGPMHTTGGAEILRDHVAKKEAQLVIQLKKSGAVILGKASLSELAGVVTTTPAGSNAMSGAGVNPYGVEFEVAGSSSGSGISTGALLTMVSVGTETSGSLIAPATQNGCVGMKPSLGVVSGEGVIPLIRFQDSAGPITRNVMDAAILLGAIDTKEIDYTAGVKADALKGVTAGILRQDLLKTEVRAANEPLIQRIESGLGAAGAKLVDVSLDPVDIGVLPFLGFSQDTIPYLNKEGAPVATVGDFQKYNAAAPDTRAPFGQNAVDIGVTLVSAITGKLKIPEAQLGDAYAEQAMTCREDAAKALAKAFADHKVEILVSISSAHSSYYATAGYPAITIPLGLDASGGPAGVTLIGKQGQDGKLLAYAYAFEQTTHFRIRPYDPMDLTLSLQGIRFTVVSPNTSANNTVTIKPAGLTADNDQIMQKVDGFVMDAEVEDLNADGSPEVYIYVTNREKKGSLIAFGANNKKSLSNITLPELSDSKGYRGGDEFSVVESSLSRRFPLYTSGGVTGKIRQVTYKLKPGESGWVLEEAGSTDIMK